MNLRKLCLNKYFLIPLMAIILGLTYLSSKFSVTKFEASSNFEKRAWIAWSGGNDYQEPEWRPKILLWTKYFSLHRLWDKYFMRIYSNECEESRCDFTSNKDEIKEADAVMFNDVNLKSLTPETMKFLNEVRSSDQIFIYLNLEAPHPWEKTFLTKFKNFFNWTMTYRKDSDIQIPYGIIRRKSRIGEKIPYVSQHELSQRNFAVWMASHCRTLSKREKFIKELKQLIPITIYGKCGNKKCGTRNLMDKVGGEDPRENECSTMIQSFKFYLAFENTLCTEYVTEKFFRSLKLGVIPIVYGATNYSTIAPPNSFIDSKDFDSIEDLVKHMKLVSQNATLYNGYLKWMENYEVDLGSPYNPLTCDLCKKLHQNYHQRTHKSYEDILKWYFETNVTCYTYQTIFQNTLKTKNYF